MKKLMAIMLLTILSTVCIFAQHGADEQGLIGLDKQWSATIDRRDSNSIDALNGITATDLTSHGRTEHKAQLVLLTLGALAPATVPADPPIDASLTCVKGNSDVALILYIKNVGPDDVASGRRIRYSYKKCANCPLLKGTYKLLNTLAAGKAVNVFINTNWTTPIYSCTASTFPPLVLNTPNLNSNQNRK